MFWYKTKKNFKKRKISEHHTIIDTFVVRGIQGTNQHNQLNPVYFGIGKSPNFNGFFRRYQNNRRYLYRFQLNSITLSTNITNVDSEILITCKGLNNAKKCDTNGEEDRLLGIIDTENIENWKQLS